MPLLIPLGSWERIRTKGCLRLRQSTLSRVWLVSPGGSIQIREHTVGFQEPIWSIQCLLHGSWLKRNLPSQVPWRCQHRNSGPLLSHGKVPLLRFASQHTRSHTKSQKLPQQHARLFVSPVVMESIRCLPGGLSTRLVTNAATFCPLVPLEYRGTAASACSRSRCRRRRRRRDFR